MHWYYERIKEEDRKRRKIRGLITDIVLTILICGGIAILVLMAKDSMKTQGYSEKYQRVTVYADNGEIIREVIGKVSVKKTNDHYKVRILGGEDFDVYSGTVVVEEA